MGNAAIEPEGEEGHQGGENISQTNETSPRNIEEKDHLPKAPPLTKAPDEIGSQETPPLTEKNLSSSDGEKKIEAIEKKISEESPKQIDFAKIAKAKTEDSKPEEHEEEVDAMEVLFQFIPYYGQGNTSHDSIVRSTLSSLSVEDIDHRDEYGNTLLLVACQYRCEAIVRILLNKGADPNAINSSGASCLHFACYKETMSKSIAKLLLQNGANPEVNETTYGCTPLHYCASTGDIDFCKMLISYGAHVGTYDYYNYTCVDYAREANMHDAAVFLQKKMLMTASQGPGAFVTSKSGGSLVFGKTDAAVSSHQTVISYGLGKNEKEKASDWIECIDPATGGRYFMDPTSGECLWENDYYRKMVKKSEVIAQSELQRVNSTMLLDTNDDLLGGNLKKVENKGSLSIEAPQAETKQVQDSATSPLKMTQSMRDMSSSAQSNVDPNTIKKLLDEAKLQSDDVLEKERVKFQGKIAEREGKIAKLESENQTLLREKERLETEIERIKILHNETSTSGGEALLEAQKAIRQLEEENSGIKSELKQTQAALAREQDKLKSLEATLKNLETGHEERILLEKQAAEERWKQQQEIETKHNQAMKEAEDRLAEGKAKYQNDINEAKAEFNRLARESEDRIDVYKKNRDQELEKLNMEMAEAKSKFAEELSNAQSMVEMYQKKNQEAQERALAAEEAQRSMEQEIEEAKLVQKFNAQLHRDLAREQTLRKKLHNEIEDMKGKIRVYVRVRPFSRSEVSKGCTEAVCKDGKMSVVVTGGKSADARKSFDFDSVFAGSMTEGNSQEDIFKDTKHLMTSVIDGYNVCIFAYGQTGSGKTFTMIGAADIGSCLQANGDFDELAGITPRAVSEIFRLLNERSSQVTFEVSVQMFQLYRDGLEDLLKAKKKGDDKGSGQLKITLAEHSPTGLVQVDGANTMVAQTPADVMNIFQLGASRRTTASTQMNAESSRSHLICSLVVSLTNRRTGSVTTGKLTLVDLAGSERVDKSGAEGEMLKEAQSINKSLSALGDVISALTSGGSHVPYRNHPLTMLMSDSIGGNAKTLMFVNCSPADYNVSETLSSLSFAQRCKDVTNSGGGPPAQQAAQLAALKKELAKLKKDKGGQGGGGTKLARPVP